MRPNTVFVAALALDFRVHPFQRKNLFVIKIHHPVHPIMAIQAGITKLIDVEAHELRPGIIARRMAGGAYLWIQDLQTLAGKLGCVAARAGERLAVKASTMAHQAEAGIFGMVERRALPAGRQPAVF